ncbi:MAG: redoxin domain-containing protein [Planctomycetota bacterium]
MSASRFAPAFLGWFLAATPLMAAPQDPVVPPKPDVAEQEKEPEKPKLLELGGKLPGSLSLADIDGAAVRSQSLRGKVVVVNFWSFTCPIMKGWEPRLKAIHDEYTDREVVFLMVNSNVGNGEIGDGEPAKEGDKPYAKIRGYLSENELPYRVLVDHGSKIADVFQAKTTPDVYVFDPEGVLVYRGLIDDDPRGNKGEKATQHLRVVLEQLLAGEKVEPKATTPIGCGIKRPAGEGGVRRGRGRRR